MLGQQLAENVRAIAARTSAPEDAIEPALKAILEGTRTSAGAVCLYDPQQQVLRLVAEVGLSDEGCRSLRTARNGLTSAWDMPLRSLLNRRAYLIEDASENRYVPQLIDGPTAKYNVACLPLYDRANPVGSLIVIGVRPAVLAEHHIQILELVQHELVTMIEALRTHAARGRTAAPRPGCASHGEETLTGSRSASDGRLPSGDATGEQDKAAATAQGSPGVETEAAPIPPERQPPLGLQPAATGKGQASTVASAQQLRELTAEIEHLRIQLADVESAAEARDSEHRKAHAAEVEHLLELLNDAREVSAKEQSLNEELRATLEQERTRSAELLEQNAAAEQQQAFAKQLEHQQQESMRELEAASAREQKTREELLATVERERATVTALKAELAAHQTDHAAEVERLSARFAESETTRAHEAASNEELSRLNAELSEKLGAAVVREEAVRGEEELVAAIERERAAVAALKTELAAHQTDHAAEVERLSARLAESETTRAQEAASNEELSRLNAELSEKLGAAVAREEAFRHEVDDLNRLAGERAAELEDARRDVSTAERALGEARAEAVAMRNKLAEAEARVSEMRGARSRLEHAATRLEPQAGDAEHERTPCSAAVLTPEHGEDEARQDTQQGQSGSAHLVIMDCEESWPEVSPHRQQVLIVAPGEDLPLRLGSSPREPVLLNLAAPGSLEAISKCRAAGLRTSFRAFIAVPGTGRVLPLGMIDTTPSPMDPELVMSGLEGHVSRGTRLLTAGADADALVSLRQGLSRQGVSVSMAWDDKQARDLLAMTRPEVVVIELDLPPRDGYGLVAQLADLDPVPRAVLIPSAADSSARLAAEAADRSRASRLITLPELLGDLL